jgi:hypothetical protein
MDKERQLVLRDRPQDPTKNIRLYYVPNIIVDITTKQKTSFLQVGLTDINYKGLFCNRGYFQANSQLVGMEARIDYRNLHLVKFEPLLETAKFEVNMEKYVMNKNENSKIKVLSRSEKDVNTKDYRKGLSVNLSTAFFHTFKELEIKYELANEDMDLWSEKCFNLTTKNTKVYEIMLKKNIKENIDWMADKSLFVTHQPNIDLKNFFGKEFVVDNKNELGKKKTKRVEMLDRRFHIEGLKVFLYHSFLEAKTKLKNTIYRTPFSLVNLVSEKVIVELDFKQTHHKQHPHSWKHRL